MFSKPDDRTKRALQNVADILGVPANQIRFENMEHGGVRIAMAKGVNADAAETFMAMLRPNSEFKLSSRSSWGNKVYRIDIGTLNNDKIMEVLTGLQAVAATPVSKSIS